MAQWMLEERSVQMALALRDIADGHNDPRAFAAEVIESARKHLTTLGK